MHDDVRIPIALVGGRGHVGAELIRLLATHPRFELVFVASRERQGQPVIDHVDAAPAGLLYGAGSPTDLPALEHGAYVLAMPNGKAGAFVESIASVAPAAVVVDLSADYRFDPHWHYGLPELRPMPAATVRIANPGCYATAMQLALAPVRELMDAPAQCFGVSGYSGAGTAPSSRNDPHLLRDNLMPYSLTGHVHEAEVSRQIGRPVEFMPHVASYFRGLTVTANIRLREPARLPELVDAYRQYYAGQPLVWIVDEAPWVSSVAGRHHAEIGGFSLAADGRRLVVVATLDNLLKGAATQALQNLNLAFGLDALTGIPLEDAQ